MKYIKGIPCPQRKNKTNHKGDKNAHWRGGRFLNKNGYVWIYKPDHPFSCKTSPKGYVYEHRLVMEKKIGRYLYKEEIVHHINGKRDDNREENLFLTSQSKHISNHNKTRTWKKTSIEKNRKNAVNRKRNSKGRFIK